MGVPLEKQLFDSANVYYAAANVIMRPSSSTTDSHLLIQPAVTCAALSLKLFFKCIRALEHNDKDDIYRLAELFGSLQQASQSKVLKKFDEYSNTSLTAGELVKHLEGLDNAFVHWRYIHEEDAKSVNLEDLEQMILAAKSYITSVKPEWG